MLHTLLFVCQVNIPGYPLVNFWKIFQNPNAYLDPLPIYSKLYFLFQIINYILFQIYF